MKRSDIINHLIERNNYKSYLEIGLDNPAINFDLIKCELKESVDPFFDAQSKDYDNYCNTNPDDNILKKLTYRMTSDEFFAQNTKKYDIIFVDGLHTKEQVTKDIINGLAALNENGKIVVHDCMPRTEICQKVPRACGEWNGDVWKAIPWLRNQGVQISVVSEDYGCGIVEPYDDPSKLNPNIESKLTWMDFTVMRNSLLNVISAEDFLKNY